MTNQAGVQERGSSQATATLTSPSRPTDAPPWLNAALTGTVMVSVLTAALSHYEQRLDPLSDIGWTLILLACSSLIRSYAAYVTHRAGQRSPRAAIVGIVRGEWALVAAGLPTVAVLLAASVAHCSTTATINVVLLMNVFLLLALGIVAASRAGHRSIVAVGFGLGDAMLGVLVIAANSLLR
jgi:hypothetical protein